VLVAVILVTVIAYIVTVVHAATMRTLRARGTGYQPQERLLSWPKWLSALIAVLLVVWLLHAVRAILLPFLLGAVIAYLLNPSIARFERRGWHRMRAIWLVFGIFLLVLIAVVLLLVPLAAQARDLAANYSYYAGRTKDLVLDARETVVAWGRLVGMLPEDVRAAFATVGEKAQAYGLRLLEDSLAWLNRRIVLASLLVVTPVVTFWVLRDYHRLGRQVLRLLPERQRATVADVLGDINRVVGSYFLGMATMVVIVGTFAVIVLTIAQVSFGVLLGIMTGVLYIIPYLGFPTALIIVALTMAVTGNAAGPILIVLGILMAGNVAFDYVVTPRVLGRRVGLHPLLVIFAVLSGATLFGVVGIVLAVPVAGAVKVVLLHFWPEAFSPEPADAQTG
jgi:predicted PurR-regulated permease PerM